MDAVPGSVRSALEELIFVVFIVGRRGVAVTGRGGRHVHVEVRVVRAEGLEADLTALPPVQLPCHHRGGRHAAFPGSGETLEFGQFHTADLGRQLGNVGRGESLGAGPC